MKIINRRLPPTSPPGCPTAGIQCPLWRRWVAVLVVPGDTDLARNDLSDHLFIYLFIYLFERSVSSSSRSPLFSLWRSSPPLLLQPFPHAPYSSSKQHSHCSSRFLLLSRIWSVPLYCSFFNQEIEFVLSPQRLARKRRCRQIKSFIFISLKIIFHNCPSNGCTICTTHDPLFL